jgi:hypothetical protein
MPRTFSPDWRPSAPEINLLGPINHRCAANGYGVDFPLPLDLPLLARPLEQLRRWQTLTRISFPAAAGMAEMHKS